MHRTGETWSHSFQVMSVTPNKIGSITDMDNPFVFLLTMEASSEYSNIYITVFLSKLKTHVCLRIKELQYHQYMDEYFKMKLRVRGKLIDKKQVLGESDYLIRSSLSIILASLLRHENEVGSFHH